MSMVAAAGSLSRLTLTRGGGLSVNPSTMYGVPGPYVWDATSARKVPAVGRAIALYGGMCKQMPIDAYRSGTLLPRPQLLARPDPDRGRPWFVQVSVEDYLLNGNAVSLITSRGADGWPTSVMWLPASWVYIQWNPANLDETNYFYAGMGSIPLNPDDVIHVRRGADRQYLARGVGVVEEYLTTLDRAAAEEEYERNTLSGSAVPSVAVITPQATITQDVADEAKARWVSNYGSTREPAILPNGTQVVPLAWSPSDTQLIESRKMTLTDVANLFNLDSYWLGAAVQGMTYKTAAPQYQQIVRTSIEPVISDFEDEWSYKWLPRGQTIAFDRNKLLSEDFPTTATAVVALVGAGVITPEQGYSLMGLPATLATKGASNPDFVNQPPPPVPLPGETEGAAP